MKNIAKLLFVFCFVCPALVFAEPSKDTEVLQKAEALFPFDQGDTWKLSKKAIRNLNRSLELASQNSASGAGFRMFHGDGRSCDVSAPTHIRQTFIKHEEHDTWTISTNMYVPKVNVPILLSEGGIVEWELLSSRGSKYLLRCSFGKKPKAIVDLKEEVDLLSVTKKSVEPVEPAAPGSIDM